MTGMDNFLLTFLRTRNKRLDLSHIGAIVMYNVTVAARFKATVIGTRSRSKAIWIGHIWSKDCITNIIFKVAFYPERRFAQIRTDFIHLIGVIENKSIVQILLTISWDEACWENFLLKKNYCFGEQTD